MDILKLFFDHDLRLDKTVERDEKDKGESKLEDFMSPSLTFSKFYLTGTRLEDEKFGLNNLLKLDSLLKKLNTVFNEKDIYSAKHASNYSFVEAVEKASIGEPVLLHGRATEVETDLSCLLVHPDSNVGHFKDELRKPLLNEHIIIYKEQAKNGYDLHIFSKKNIYKLLFYPLKELVDDSFRFFSINSKRMHSERHFYFETWTLDRPPHGAEEVFEDTEI